MKFRTTEGSSVALFHWPLRFKDKSKTVGVARQQLHFLCSDKENEAKESLALRWACLVRNGGNLNSDGSYRSRPQLSPAGDEALVSLYSVEDCIGHCAIKLFSCRSH